MYNGTEDRASAVAVAPDPVAAPVTVAARAEQVVKVYGRGATEVRALDAVDVAFVEGEFCAIMGPSGSGKSTLLHCMAGLDRCTGGRAFIGDTDLSRLDDKALTILRRNHIGFVFQSFNLIPTLTAAENIRLPLALGRRSGDAAWISTVIRAVCLGDRLQHRPAELSGGQQQRVAVARALATRPRIVFADEPTGNLDSRAGAAVLGLLRDAAEQTGQTVVMVTHDPVAASYAQRVVFLADGRVVDEMPRPTAARVLDRMKQFGA